MQHPNLKQMTLLFYRVFGFVTIQKLCLKCLYYLHICNSKHFPCFAVFCYALVHFQSFVHSPLTDQSVIQMQTDAQKSNLHDMNRLPPAAELFAAAGRWCTHFAAQVCFFFAALSLLYCLYTCLHTHIYTTPLRCIFVTNAEKEKQHTFPYGVASNHQCYHTPRKIGRLTSVHKKRTHNTKTAIRIRRARAHARTRQKIKMYVKETQRVCRPRQQRHAAGGMCAKLRYYAVPPVYQCAAFSGQSSVQEVGGSGRVRLFENATKRSSAARSALFATQVRGRMQILCRTHLGIIQKYENKKKQKKGFCQQAYTFRQSTYTWNMFNYQTKNYITILIRLSVVQIL